MQKHKQPPSDTKNLTVSVTDLVTVSVNFTDTSSFAFSTALNNNRIRTFFVKGSANG